MILSFRCKDTEKLFQGHRIEKWVAIERTAFRKLVQLELAMRLDDMRAPPANRLEPVDRNKPHHWRVWIDDRYSLRFLWFDAGAEDVEIVDEKG